MDQYLDAFELAWQHQKQPPSIDAILKQASPDEQLPLLKELSESTSIVAGRVATGR